MSRNIEELLQTAKDDGVLSGQSMQALMVADIGQQIEAALGVPAMEIESSEVVLVTVMVDDSGSIKGAGNEQTMIDGHNYVYQTIIERSSRKDSILAHTRYLNGFVLFDYRPIMEAVMMDDTNYDACHGTPLYDQSVVLLGTVVAKAQEFANEGVPVRTITLIATDGHDEHSVSATPAKVASIVNDMLMQETHIVAAMGIDDGGRTDFAVVFKSMGLRDQWILTPDNTQDEILKAFALFSQSAVQASQGAGSFSKTSVGGFVK